ncbi:MAG: sulfite exporter TauE/SafE family protein [Pseudomonadota bacterium]
MQIYLPIAEVSVNAFLLLGLGGLVGVLSGMFGVGGGFLMTPLLFFIGIPPAVAVATEANQIVASSFSGVLAHLRRKTVDFKMGGVLTIGGVIGAAIGVQIFALLTALGQVDLLVRLCYVVFLGIIGSLMFVESLRAIRRARAAAGAPPIALPKRKRGLVDSLPFKTRFRTSGLYISVIPPLTVGFFVGILAAIMGVGGGFIMVPAMIYLLGMPTKVVVGTSLLQIIFVTGFATLMHATTNFTVDMVLAVLLLLGGVVGAQIGTTLGVRMKAEQLRILLAIMVLAVCGRLAMDLLLEPSELFTLGAGTAH